MTAAGDARREKEARQRLQACIGWEREHLRIGNRRADGTALTFIAASVWDLHGAVCTCCPRETTERQEDA